MTDPTLEQVQSVTDLVVQISQVLSVACDENARAALATVCAQRCILNPNPDRAFLEIMDAALAVFREASNAKYRTQDPAVS